MHRTGHRLSLTAALAGALLLSTVGPASAAWDPVKILRSIPGGDLLTVEDIAGLGSRVVVGWQEEGADPKAFMRWSVDGSATWKPRKRLDTRPRRELQVDTCAGRAWAVSGLHVPGAPASEWLITLDGFEMAGFEFESSLVSLSGQGRTPDLACAGTKRLAVAWFKKVSGGHRVKLFSRGLFPDVLSGSPTEVRLDLGKGNLQRGLSVAATQDRIYVAWFTGTKLKLKRFLVGPGPDLSITPLATQVLADLPYGSTPKLGAAGTRVALAYTRRADLFARMSSDRGASWGTQRKLRDEPFPSEVAASATNVDVRGKRVLVSGIEVGGVETLSGEGFLYRSTDWGASWSLVPGSTKAGGEVVGAFMSPGGTTKMIMAWDESLVFEAGAGPQSLRFRRQS